jgi:membrane associated rhomboid family serine protease
MFPLKDDNPTSITPLVTWALIAMNVLVFFYQLSLGPVENRFIYQFGAIPAVITGQESLSRNLAVIPPFLSIFTSMFLHGGWMHLIGNMWFLWIFGNNIEEAMGSLRYFVFYILCGLAASLAHVFFNAGSTVPSIGASGAIAGVLGAYLMLYPRARVLTLVFLFIFIRIMWLPAGILLGLWFFIQIWSGALAGSPAGGGVAFWAHVGGFLAGILLVGLFKKREIRFFNPVQHSMRYYD